MVVRKHSSLPHRTESKRLIRILTQIHSKASSLYFQAELETLELQIQALARYEDDVYNGTRSGPIYKTSISSQKYENQSLKRKEKVRVRINYGEKLIQVIYLLYTNEMHDN